VLGDVAAGPEVDWSDLLLVVSTQWLERAAASVPLVAGGSLCLQRRRIGTRRSMSAGGAEARPVGCGARCGDEQVMQMVR
jgi:hypothetical protein